MKKEYSEKRRLVLRRSDKILLGVLALLSVVIVVLSILQRFGLSLINASLMLYLPALAVFVLVGWGAYALIRRIRNQIAKIVVGSLSVLLISVALMLVLSYMSFMSAITVPQRYTALQSPSGAHRLVVMRLLDSDEARVEARRAARLAADPDGDPEITIRDWGYVYRAYPRALGLFYRSDADVEGELYLAYNDPVAPAADAEEGETGEAVELPRGTMMVEWLEDEAVAHFFVDSPGAGEGGECTVRF